MRKSKLNLSCVLGCKIIASWKIFCHSSTSVSMQFPAGDEKYGRVTWKKKQKTRFGVWLGGDWGRGRVRVTGEKKRMRMNKQTQTRTNEHCFLFTLTQLTRFKWWTSGSKGGGFLTIDEKALATMWMSVHTTDDEAVEEDAFDFLVTEVFGFSLSTPTKRPLQSNGMMKVQKKKVEEGAAEKRGEKCCLLFTWLTIEKVKKHKSRKLISLFFSSLLSQAVFALTKSWKSSSSSKIFRFACDWNVNEKDKPNALDCPSPRQTRSFDPHVECFHVPVVVLFKKKHRPLLRSTTNFLPCSLAVDCAKVNNES